MPRPAFMPLRKASRSYSVYHRRYAAKDAFCFSVRKLQFVVLQRPGCADLSALWPVATCRDHVSFSFQRMRRLAAADQSGDRLPHSKGVTT
jgi:hypothetical protein